MLDNIPLALELKLEPFPVDYDNVHEAWDPLECEANIQLPVVPKIEPSSAGNDNDDGPWDHEEFRAGDSDDDHLPISNELNDEETSEDIIEMGIEKEESHRDFDGPEGVTPLPPGFPSFKDLTREC